MSREIAQARQRMHRLARKPHLKPARPGTIFSPMLLTLA